MNIGQLVRIGGRTRLSPTISLVGLTGIVVPTAGNAPAGCCSVWVNWEDGGYQNADDFPRVVNVPEAHLEAITQDELDAEKPKPKLQSVAALEAEAEKAAAKAKRDAEVKARREADQAALFGTRQDDEDEKENETDDAPDNQKNPDDGRPSLRLV